MFSQLTLHTALLAILFGALLCLGWQAMAAVWSALTSGKVPDWAVGLAVLIVAAVVLVVVK